MNELDTVVLTRSLPEHRLQAGDVGAVVHVYGDQQAFETEFVTGGGDAIALVTLSPADMRAIEEHEVLHLRRIPA